jgi:sigma-B regulation protein RsbU (phosphoserine phosphatase)
MALGVMEDSSFEERTVRLNPGDFVFLYTDGVTEATDTQEQEFGEERLQRVILDKRHAPAAEMVAGLEQALRDFVGASSPFDDITIVAAKRP